MHCVCSFGTENKNGGGSECAMSKRRLRAYKSSGLLGTLFLYICDVSFGAESRKKKKTRCRQLRELEGWRRLLLSHGRFFYFFWVLEIFHSHHGVST